MKLEKKNTKRHFGTKNFLKLFIEKFQKHFSLKSFQANFWRTLRTSSAIFKVAVLMKIQLKLGENCPELPSNFFPGKLFFLVKLFPHKLTSCKHLLPNFLKTVLLVCKLFQSCLFRSMSKNLKDYQRLSGIIRWRRKRKLSKQNIKKGKLFISAVWRVARSFKKWRTL